MDRIYIAKFGEYYGGETNSYHKTEQGARDFLAKRLRLKNKEFLEWANYENNMDIFFDNYYWRIIDIKLRD